MSSIYMDWNDATPPDPRVVDLISTSLEDVWGNPSSINEKGISRFLCHLYSFYTDL